ncbi:MAG: hypothetical protein Q6368_003380 [Candidatus Baldrarchaeota archaeon]
MIVCVGLLLPCKKAGCVVVTPIGVVAGAVLVVTGVVYVEYTGIPVVMTSDRNFPRVL